MLSNVQTCRRIKRKLIKPFVSEPVDAYTKMTDANLASEIDAFSGSDAVSSINIIMGEEAGYANVDENNADANHDAASSVDAFCQEGVDANVDANYRFITSLVNHTVQETAENDVSEEMKNETEEKSEINSEETSEEKFKEKSEEKLKESKEKMSENSEENRGENSEENFEKNSEGTYEIISMVAHIVSGEI